MSTRDAEKLVEEIVADLAEIKRVEGIVADLTELRASLAEQFSALRENLKREFAMLKLAFQTRDPNQPLQ
jgi:hypothetical protein